jgi:hypothetical protein
VCPVGFSICPLTGHWTPSALFKVWSSCGLGQGEVTVDPDVCLIVCVAQWWFGVAVLSPGLEVGGIFFAKGESSFPAIPESLCADEDAGEYGVVEWSWRDAGECQIGRTFEHGVVEAENVDAGQAGECLEVVVELAEVLPDAALVLVQDCSRDVRVPVADAACGCCPGEEMPKSVRFLSRLALAADGLSCLSDADVGQVEPELAARCTVEEFCRLRDLVMCGRGVREKPVGFYKNVRHCC